jgi:hypothetical protein
MTWLGQAGDMKPSPDPRRGHRFPAEIIAHAVWLYYVFGAVANCVEIPCGDVSKAMEHRVTLQGQCREERAPGKASANHQPCAL